MIPQQIRLEIATPTGIVFSDMVRYVKLPAAQGSIGILPGHAPLLTTLVPGVLKYQVEGHVEYMAVSDGFVEITDNVVIILAHTAEEAAKIDIARAEAAKNRAKQRLASHDPQVNTAQAEAALRRAIARLQASKYKG